METTAKTIYNIPFSDEWIFMNIIQFLMNNPGRAKENKSLLFIYKKGLLSLMYLWVSIIL